MKASTAAQRDAFLDAIRSGHRVMGILNVTPDSFSDGGAHDAPEPALARAAAMMGEGAAILDIGGESTRPGFTPVPAEEEWRRVGPVLTALAERGIGPLSVDTTKADVAVLALQAGAAVVNDVWGFQGDPRMAEAVSANDGAAVLMHNRHSVDPEVDIVDDMLRFFEASLEIAEDAFMPRDWLVLDPGIGFGKTQDQQLRAIAAIPVLRRTFGLPVLAGLSRKGFLGRITGAPVERRGAETLAANLAAAAAGATVLRVHDVAEHVAALAVFGALGGLSAAGVPFEEHRP